MFRHSYITQLKRYETDRLALLLDLERSPNKQTEYLIKQIEDQINWLKKQIKEGNDPGVHTI